MLPSGASSDAPKPCDCDSRTVKPQLGLDANWTESDYACRSTWLARSVTGFHRSQTNLEEEQDQTEMTLESVPECGWRDGRSIRRLVSLAAVTSPIVRVVRAVP
jgi:hypothetical protein